MDKDSLYILAIESSCDDTACSILKDNQVLSNVVINQSVHVKYGGVVPELASRAHQSNIVPVVELALKEAGIQKTQLDAIAFTSGPGLMGSLLVGTSFAKSLSLALRIPLIDVHHMRGHILAHFIKSPRPAPQLPFLALTISGGHTQIVRVNTVHNMEVLGQTRDDAVGEAFDKTGKMLGLGYPAGPQLDRLAQDGDSLRFEFPVPKAPALDYSFSGFKTAVLYFLQKEIKKNANFIAENLNDLCASIQHTIVRILFKKLELAVKQTGITTVAIGGGVSANSAIRKKLESKQEQGWSTHIPPFEYTTDNAAMIGIAAYYKLLDKDFASMDTVAQPRFSL
ncbi:MAG: tRNA (adenosine(37)-N6)-threonylcarbamoyltransferase complex transferase subunit TsaD [Nonlabens sp.]